MDHEKAPEGGDVDLFGAPVSQIRERWGRPSFAKTKENQELVATLRAAGWSQSQIAEHLGCDEKTLRKHFSRELRAGAELIEAMALQVLVKRMRQGHVPSTRLLLGLIEDRGRPAVPPPPPDHGTEKPLGKKAQLDKDAQDPTPGWDRLLN